MVQNHIILMADIIQSSKLKQAALMRDFKQLVAAVNQIRPALFLSPPTITLGDEFQAVARDLGSALIAIMQLEEAIIGQGLAFKLRYVVLEGAIDTPINKKNAHGMLGPGLTAARELLDESKKSGIPRFTFDLVDADQGTALRNLFVTLQTIIDGWRVAKDYAMVAQFLEHTDYKRVAEQIQKDRSQVYKRGRSLMIDAYLAQKAAIQYVGATR
jgi:hypothetical protein